MTKRTDTLILGAYYEQATCMGKMADQIIDIIKKKGYEIDFTKYEVNITELAHYSVYATSDE